MKNITPAERKFIENTTIAFAMFCDEQGMSAPRGWNFAEEVSEAILHAADDREIPD